MYSMTLGKYWRFDSTGALYALVSVCVTVSVLLSRLATQNE